MEYRALVLAGYGAVGRGIGVLGEDFLARFPRLRVLDRRPPREPLPVHPDAAFHLGDIEETDVLRDVLSRLPTPFLFVNCCTGTDNLRLRREVAAFGGAYFDTACSSLQGSSESRYSRLMPRTLTPVDNSLPHLVCCGANPGMVELAALQMMREHFPDADAVDVGFFEHDGLRAALPGGKVAVSWSPETLVEEILDSPSLRLVEGRSVEGAGPGCPSVDVLWEGRRVPSRLVGHEELWTLGLLRRPRVRHASFCYAFAPEVMATLEGSAAAARACLAIPGTTHPIEGLERLAVRVVDARTGRQRTRLWRLDHGECRRRYGLNAVQVQVAASVLVFLEILLVLEPRQEALHCASSLPLEALGWDRIEGWMRRYGVRWEEAPELELAVRSPREQPGSFSAALWQPVL